MPFTREDSDSTMLCASFPENLANRRQGCHNRKSVGYFYSLDEQDVRHSTAILSKCGGTDQV